MKNDVDRTMNRTMNRNKSRIINKNIQISKNINGDEGAGGKTNKQTVNNPKEKVVFKPGTMLNPVPVVMVSCGGNQDEYNIITIAWTGIINTDPPLTYISVRKSRFSYELLVKNRGFVINLVDEKTAFAADYCGVKSGRDVDKFHAQKLTPLPAEAVKAPLIEECPVNIECKVLDIVSYQTHDMFISEIVKVHADKGLMDQKGKLRLEDASLICFCHGAYYGLKSRPLGDFGYSVMKPKTKSRIARAKRAKSTPDKSR